MAKVWGGKTYDTDWYEIDAFGNRTSNQKDWQANREWDAANDPAGAWNFSQEVAQANPVPWDTTARGKQHWSAVSSGVPASPTAWMQGAGAWNAIGNQPRSGGFDWGGWQGTAPTATPTSPGAGMPPRGGQIGQVPVFDPSAGHGLIVDEASPYAGIGPVPHPILLPQAQQTMPSPAFAPTVTPPSPLPQVGAAPQVGAPQGLAAMGTAQQVSAPVALGNVGAAPQVGAPPGLAAMGAAQQVSAPVALANLGAAPQATSAQMGALGPTQNVALGGPESAFSQQVRGAISRDLGAPTINPADPVLQAQLASFRAANQRATERQRAQEAQRANVGGTIGSGGFNTRMRALEEQQGIRDADFEAQLMASELASGRDRAERARQLGAGLLTQEAQQGLTERLANQQAAMQAMGLQTQRDVSNLGAQQQMTLANQQAALQMLGLQSGREQTQQALAQQANLANQAAGLQMAGLQSARDVAQQDQAMRAALANQAAGLQTLGLQSQRDLAQQGFGMQAGLANQAAGLQMAGLQSARDIAQQDQAMRAALANQAAGLQTLGLQSQRDLAQQGYGMQAGLANQAAALQAALANQQAGLTGRGQDISRELGLLEAGQRGRGLDIQQELGRNDALIRRNALELQRQLGLTELDLRQLGLGMQDAQFYAGLGTQQGLEQARLNQQALLALLGGR